MVELIAKIVFNPFRVGTGAVLSPGCYPGLKLSNAFGVNKAVVFEFSHSLDSDPDTQGQIHQNRERLGSGFSCGLSTVLSEPSRGPTRVPDG